LPEFTRERHLQEHGIVGALWKPEPDHQVRGDRHVIVRQLDLAANTPGVERLDEPALSAGRPNAPQCTAKPVLAFGMDERLPASPIGTLWQFDKRRDEKNRARSAFEIKFAQLHRSGFAAGDGAPFPRAERSCTSDNGFRERRSV
jgi:hypothetical protein